ncbi:MAG: putative toxin-antitoxin system toxin component, PIN family [Candidatus Diapherotrites archaeon]|nr:putative toxin-antitoxin system toxin component, PIN family [Candidatus Diapherotrites archaeon]
MRVVFDTNVLVSASFWDGPSKMATEFATHGEIISITSVEILNEYEGILKRDFRQSPERAKEGAKWVRRFSLVVFPTKPIDAVKADPEDNKIIEAAVEGNADFIVSGDRHLLKFEKFGNIQIIAPRKLIEMLEQ